jgi:DNA-binding PadR family transcriptional regulator
MAKRRAVGNLLALTLLAQLVERPMYPYELATLLRTRGKDKAVKINWGSLYTVVQNLDKHGLIEAVEVDRHGRQPERTTYRITDAGRAELADWLRELISVPEPEYPTFAAALQEAANLPPDEVAALLRQRLGALDSAIAASQAELEKWAPQIPRVFMIESEYQLAMHQAEAQWVRGLLGELTDGTMASLDIWRRYHETGEIPPEVAVLSAGPPPAG